MSFDTIKSKIILISVLMLTTISILLSFFAYLYLQNGKSLLLKSYSNQISNFAQEINKDIIRIENNAKDLALQGKMFYTIDKNRNMALLTTINIFNNYPYSLGGGIWFEPNTVDKSKRFYCIYVYRNKNNEVVPDTAFETEEYNYLGKSWYGEIKKALKQENSVAWSLPYFEQEGSNTLMVTAGSGIYSQGEIIGISTVDWEISSIIKLISEMKPTKNSFALFGDKDHNTIIATNDPYIDNSELLGKSLSTLPWYNENLKYVTYFTYQGQKYIPYVKTLDNGMFLIINIPKNELFYYLMKNVFILFGIFMLMGLIVSTFLYYVLKKYIDIPIEKLTKIASKISGGDLDTEIKLDKPSEFAHLAETFNKITKDIKNITKDRQRIESELSLAKAIQASSLPSVFPPYPERNEFDIYAGMEPAKEVGGDFYDFYFIDNDNLMFLIADVSGKGVPAALFMMTTKTLINYVAKSKMSPKEMIETINKKICENNKQGFFITLIAGIINVKTGKTTFINCGHNPPLIKQSDGAFRYLELDSNIVLGAFESATFNISEVQLNDGDLIFLYTDGITEAVNAEDVQYGEDRLMHTVNNLSNTNVKTMLNDIKSDVKIFAQGVDQSDDRTALVLKYNGLNNIKKETYSGIAKQENFNHFISWIIDVCDIWSLNKEVKEKIHLISEELYTNIFSYAYKNNEGEFLTELIKDENQLTIIFKDYGVQYNPLESQDPDINLPPENREIGGLGIFIVKNSVDEISYDYKDNLNILEMKIFL